MFLNRLKAYTRLSTVRLTLSLLLVFFVVTATASIGTYWLVQREMNQMVDLRLQAQASLIAAALENEQEPPRPIFGQQFVIQFGDGTIGSLPFPVPERSDGNYLYDRRGPEFRYLVQTLPSGERIIISENAERQDELLDSLSGGIQISLLGMLAAGLFAGFWFALRGQKRVDTITSGLERLAQGQLKTRIELPGREDDLSALADRINTTTERLELVMHQMRVQSSNIAHDLRTPLARLRAGIETSLIELTQHDRPVDAETLDDALSQIDRIVGTFNALLRLSRIESGAGRDAFEEVDLADLVTQLAETFGPVVEDAGQSFRLDIAQPELISGDRELLVQLVANLIQNALRYGAHGQEILLEVKQRVLMISDHGPGIPAEEREKVLQPLYQIENTRQNDGFGLGLSMVKAISALHAATLELAEGRDGQGLLVRLKFP